MCDFVSWIEKDGKVYFLTANQIFNTAKGKALQQYCGSSDDYVGHGAIREYYGLSSYFEGNRECTDFSTPANFPPEIAKAIKDGKFRGLGAPAQLITQDALVGITLNSQYTKAQAEWDKSWDERDRDWAKWNKARDERDKAWVKWDKVHNQTFWDLFADVNNRNPAWR